MRGGASPSVSGVPLFYLSVGLSVCLLLQVSCCSLLPPFMPYLLRHGTCVSLTFSLFGSLGGGAFFFLRRSVLHQFPHSQSLSFLPFFFFFKARGQIPFHSILLPLLFCRSFRCRSPYSNLSICRRREAEAEEFQPRPSLRNCCRVRFVGQ